MRSASIISWASWVMISWTHAKTGNLPAGYAFLLKASTLSPWDGDIKNNLDFVRKQLGPVVQNISPSGLVKQIPEEVFRLPEHSWIFFTLFFLCLALSLRLWRTSLLGGQIICFSLSLVSLFILGFYFAAGENQLYIVSAKDAKLRSGPSNSFPEIMAMDGGSMVRAGETRDGWSKLFFTVKNEKGRELVGWIDSRSLISIVD